MAVRGDVPCSQCTTMINRVLWNYGKNRPITQFFCDNVCKGNWQRAQREALGYTQEWLYQKYIVEGLGANEIARAIGRDGKRVWEWLADYGIPTRPRGSDARQHFIKGEAPPFLGCKHRPETIELLRKKARERDLSSYANNGSYLKDRRGDKHPNWKGGISPERQAFYSSEEWKVACKTAWHRADAKCERCGKHHNTAASRGTFHIHHVISFSHKPTRADPNNLRLLCTPCHRFVHSKANLSREFIGEVHAS